MSRHYSWPAGFAYESPWSQAQPFVNDKFSFCHNAERQSKNFNQHIRSVRNDYSNDEVLIPMGDDFTYFNAELVF